MGKNRGRKAQGADGPDVRQPDQCLVWPNSDAILVCSAQDLGPDTTSKTQKMFGVVAERLTVERPSEAIVIKPQPHPTQKMSSKAPTSPQDQAPDLALLLQAEPLVEEMGSPSLLQIMSQDSSQLQSWERTAIKPTEDLAHLELLPQHPAQLTPQHQDHSQPAQSDSPQQMPIEIQEQGQQLSELLRVFKESTTKPLSEALLSTPTQKDAGTMHTNKSNIRPIADKQRESPRHKGKGAQGKSIIKRAQEIVACKCGIVEDNDHIDDMTLQQYINMYKQPLNEISRQAILKLTEVAVVSTTKAKKKSKDKKKSKLGSDKPARVKKADAKNKKKKDKKSKDKKEAHGGAA